MEGKQNIQQFLLQLFQPTNFRYEQRLAILQQKGGLSYLLNNINVSHRQGLSHYGNNQLRRQIYGSNQKPPGESILRKSLHEERDFLVNLLLYVLTLKIGVKILLWQNGDQSVQIITIWRQLAGIALIFLIIYLKAMVNVNYSKMDKDFRKYINQYATIRRDGQQVLIRQKQIMVGDILIISELSILNNQKRIIRIDGILLQSKKLLVSEAHTILRKDATNKRAFWGQGQQNISNPSIDPFILAGSEVISGSAEILVCTVGQNCSFRRKFDQSDQVYEQTPVIIQTKKILNCFQLLGRAIGISVAFLTIIVNLYNQHVINQQNDEPFTWRDFNEILRIFSQFLAMICLLQRLKIVKSLKFFIQQNRSGTYFCVKNKQAIQSLSQADIIVLQESVIAKCVAQVRQEIVIEIPNIKVLSYINKFYKVKIITVEDRQYILKHFGRDIPDRQIYIEHRSATSENNITRLMDSTFITKCSVDKFVDQILPIYQSIGYKVAYLSNAQNLMNNNFPPQILHITFQKVGAKQQRCIDKSWVKLKNKLMVQDILEQLVHKSFCFAKLHNAYMTLSSNNAIIFLYLCCNSLFKQAQFNLAWTLSIIIVNRYTFFDIYGRIAIGKEFRKFAERSFTQIIKFNLFVLPLYCYIAISISNQANIFILLVANSLFRTEALLCKTNRTQPFKYWMAILIMLLAINITNIFIDKEEGLQCFCLTISMALLYSFYVLIA